MRRSLKMKHVNRIQNLHPNEVSTCKMLFLLILALSVSSGVCDELYKEAGKEVSLQCGAPQNSDIEWRLNSILLIGILGKTGLSRKGSGHTADKVNLYGDTLKVPSLEPRDSGVYSCTQSGKQYMLHVVSVFVKPGPVLIQSSDVELHCNIEGDPNTEVEWLRPPNDQRYDAKNQKINLKSVTSSDEGKWTCKVKDLKLSVTLTVVANHQINNVSATEGDNIELPCFLPHPVSQLVLGGKWKADHLPTVSFPTLKNTAGKGLHCDGVNSSEVKYNIETLGSNFNVTLIKVQSSFAGKFVCEVEFEHGGKLTAVTNLVVLAKIPDKTEPHAPCVSSGECEVLLYQEVGKEVSLDCGAPPNSDIEWRLNNNLIISNNGKSGTRCKGSGPTAEKANIYGDTLKVPRLEPRDSGVYSCIQSGKQYMLHVVSVFVKPGPVLVQSSDAELYCNIDGKPNTEVEWLRPPNDQRYDAKHQVIHLKSVTSNDGGKWTCVVNDFKFNVTLTVVGGGPHSFDPNLILYKIVFITIIFQISY
ncbi:hemicentin-2-like isoform X2 [Danio aesculapii]|uniref:hemicentin-2-like isoform X2 n=1 Tax=Danio aesculapii TaxID=1142201 RepID=UPI0024BFCFEF|nr:hemicentin-2-like isoform X2 [Danio aesculapii]